MMRPSHTALLAATLTALAGVAFSAQQGVPAQPGTPSRQPGTRNPPTQTPTQPGNTPSTQPPADPKTQPGNTPGTNTPGTNQPNTPGAAPGTQPGTTNPATRTTASNRYMRPFAFQSPEYEARFTENSRRLVQMEQRMQQNNAALLKRLGEVRAMTGERQSAATLDLLQQILQDNASLNQYLSQSRTAWSGDLDTGLDGEQNTDLNNRPSSTTPGNATPGNTTPRTPTTTQPGTTQPGTTQPSTNPPR